jgi:hypothetical protein
MAALIRTLGTAAILLVALPSVSAAPVPADDHDSVVIVYKNGHRQTLSPAEIIRLELKPPAAIVYKNGHREKISGDIDRIEFADNDLSSRSPTRSHYVGKWEVGEGNGGRFFITLEADGDAKKSIGSPHGTWTLVDGEARIAWDDGWHDVIRKVGSRHEKRAYEPGKSFSDDPSNVTSARNTQPKPI